MTKSVKKHNHDQTSKAKTAMKKSCKKSKNQATFANKARKTKTKCYVAKPTLGIVYESNNLYSTFNHNISPVTVSQWYKNFYVMNIYDFN